MGVVGARRTQPVDASKCTLEKIRYGDGEGTKASAGLHQNTPLPFPVPLNRAAVATPHSPLESSLMFPQVMFPSLTRGCQPPGGAPLGSWPVSTGGRDKHRSTRAPPRYHAIVQNSVAKAATTGVPPRPTWLYS